MEKLSIKSIAIGKAKKYVFGEKIFESAYKKDQFFDNIGVNKLGLLEDQQVDSRFHGGLDKAIHIGSYKHLTMNKKFDKLFIGCNILVDNLDESSVCVGDIYRMGEVKIEVSQPRQPCWKIGALFGKDESKYISNNVATGWYVRVLTEGSISILDEMVLEKRVSSLSIKDLSLYLKTPPEDRKIIDEILNLNVIAKSYKEEFLFALQRNNS